MNGFLFPNINIMDNEVAVFVIIEFIIILTFFIFFRYSRNNGGAFDRRVGDRRIYKRRATDWFVRDRRLADNGFSRINVEFAKSNEIFEVDIDRRVSGRRNGERRIVHERRNSIQ